MRARQFVETDRVSGTESELCQAVAQLPAQCIEPRQSQLSNSTKRISAEHAPRERTAVECEAFPVPSVLAGTDWLRVLLMKNRGFYQW